MENSNAEQKPETPPATTPTPKTVSENDPAAELKKWNDAFKTPAAELKEVKAGEFDSLLERYNTIAKKMGIEKPPPLKMIMSPLVGQMGGASGSLQAVTVSQQLTKVLTPKEMNSLLAHELGHVKDQLLKKSLNDWKKSETSADANALEATGDPESSITGLTKISDAQIKETAETFKKLLGNKPDELAKTLSKLESGQKEMLEWRIAGIRNAAPKSAAKR